MKIPPPFSRKFLEEILNNLAGSVNHGECASIINLAKRDQLYRINQILKNPAVFRKYLKRPDTQILALDIFSDLIEDRFDLKRFIEVYHSQMNLLRIYPSKTALIPLSGTNQRKMGIHTRSNKKSVIFVLDSDKP